MVYIINTVRSCPKVHFHTWKKANRLLVYMDQLITITSMSFSSGRILYAQAEEQHPQQHTYLAGHSAELFGYAAQL
ncbi:hypothetical protein Mapa_014305 [Marchantia paleacea]|nr:hypothetical protein Mapa_014305 [Marchantia paleacea]